MKHTVLFLFLVLTSCSTQKVNYRTISSDSKLAVAHSFYKHSWLESHDTHLLVESFNKLINSNGAIDEQFYLRLKELRKKANLYRISFVIFSEKGTPPKKLNNYVKRFGKLNDALDAKQFDVAVKEAKWLSSWVLESDPKKIGSNFKPITLKIFKKKMRKTLQELIKSYSTNKISQHELHSFRKKLKFFLQIYFYDEIVTGKPLPLAGVLDAFIDEVGFTHDDYSRKLLNGSLTAEDEFVLISAKERDQFFSIANNIKEDIFGKSCKSIISRLFK